MEKSYAKIKREDTQNQVKAALFNFIERNNTINNWEQ